MGTMVKKWKIAPFLNKGTIPEPNWFRIKKSTAFDLALNPETQDYDYISDESPTTEIIKYKPSLTQSLTMYKGEDDYEEIFNHFYNLHTGSDAKTEILLVFFQESQTVGSNTYYKAWKSDCVIAVNNLNSVDSTLSFDIFMNGTVDKGYITITDGSPVYTSGDIPTE
ncbi:MAG: hypothetical protein K6F69_10045 [Treponema sp.]|nr:hypothetical protein [Treponema sp.]